MKIYVIVVEDKNTGRKWIGKDWVGDDPYDLINQEVFLSEAHAREVFESIILNDNQTSSLHVFEV